MGYAWGIFVFAWGLFIATATPGAFWLDSSELTAAGVTLGVPHPPGHPLYVLLSYAASLLPVGTVSFRVALLSGLLSAAAAVVLYRLTLDVLAHVSTARSSSLIALWTTLTFTVSEALWLQSTRAEVYSLHLLIVLVVTRWCVLISVGSSTRTSPLILLSGVLIACGLANHHLLMFAALPGLLVITVPACLARGEFRLLGRAVVIAALGVICFYAVTLLRAQTTPLMNYGDPSTIKRLWAVMTAQVFVPSVTEVSAPLADNLTGAFDMYLRALGPVLLLATPFGLLYIATMRPQLALMFVAGITVNLATKVLMVLDPTNPDAAGYFLYGMALCSICASGAFDALFRRGRWGQVATAGAAALSILVVIGLWPSPRTDMSDLRGPMTLDSMIVSEMEPDALALTSLPFLHFSRLYHHSVEGHRPDILTVHQGLERHIDEGRSLARAMTARDPRTKPLFNRARMSYPVDVLKAQAKQRPVYIEPSLSLPIPAQSLSTHGAYYAIESGMGAKRGRSPNDSALSPIMDVLGSEATSQRESMTTLGLICLGRVVAELRRGDAKSARAELRQLNRLSPGSRWATPLEPRVAALENAVVHPDPQVLQTLVEAMAREDFETLLFSTSQ